MRAIKSDSESVNPADCTADLQDSYESKRAADAFIIRKFI